MQNSIDFFRSFWDEVKRTSQWTTMESTVEGTEWHREANVAVHTAMCIEHYIRFTAPERTEREQLMTLMTLLFHDFGKPEAEEVLPTKDGSEGTRNRYAGHEPISANEFISFVCDHQELMMKFFARGFNWNDIMKIKFMIEHHLPYGLKNVTKRQNLRNTIAATLGRDERCFYDQLWSDCNGRISDDHETKKSAVSSWISEFLAIPVTVPKAQKTDAPTMFVLCGTVGSGKSTWVNRFRQMNPNTRIGSISEDDYRLNFWRREVQVFSGMYPTKKSEYAEAWRYCAMENPKGYDKYSKEEFWLALNSGCTLVLDRTNQTRKSRGPWITAAKSKGYRIVAVQFYISESVMRARQKTRPDKDVPYHRAHEIFMKMETPWLSIEVDEIEVVPAW